MVRRSLAVLLLLGIFAVGALSSTRPSSAETLVQQNVDTRVVLAFRVGHAALQMATRSVADRSRGDGPIERCQSHRQLYRTTAEPRR